MATLIGADGSIATTWGSLRCAYGNMAQDFTGTSHTVEFNSGFKSAEGNGFLRYDPVLGVAFYRQPFFVYTGSYFYMENAWSLGMVPNEERAELIGETVDVTAASGTFAMTADAFDSSTGQLTTVGGGGPIVSIGKLTAF